MKETLGEKLMLYLITGVTIAALVTLYPFEYLENGTKWSEYIDIYLK